MNLTTPASCNETGERIIRRSGPGRRSFILPGSLPKAPLQADSTPDKATSASTSSSVASEIGQSRRYVHTTVHSDPELHDEPQLGRYLSLSRGVCAPSRSNPASDSTPGAKSQSHHRRSSSPGHCARNSMRLPSSTTSSSTSTSTGTGAPPRPPFLRPSPGGIDQLPSAPTPQKTTKKLPKKT
ncbi:hypothetical protein KC19_1G289900 [Ceratodon purpureus]|uniref:Uncharacterized protein n=1 Tax=Ceratodon purpureus TaxID=3225 RepID=A0A8T0JBS5_CERPU|nr:hypothetical protein KC19_1G289900 [Ceratodon purpureus]